MADVLTINVPMEFARDQFLGKLQTGEYRTEPAICFCGSSASEIVSDFDRYCIPLQTVLCLNCGLMYLKERLTEDSARQWYATEYRMLYQTLADGTAVEAMTPDDDFVQAVNNGSLLREICEQYDVRPTSVIDIGCNSGGMLKPFVDDVLDCHGVDWDEGSIAYGQEQGLPIERGDAINLIARGMKADLVILHHVLEHCYDLRKTLNECRQLLTPKGVLWIGVPGIKTTPIATMFQSAHLWHFTYDTLEYVLNCCGYSQLYCTEKIQSLWRDTGIYRKTSAVHPTALNDIADVMGTRPDVIHEVKTVSKFPIAVQRDNAEAVLAAGFPDFSTVRDSQAGKRAVVIGGGPSVEGQLPALRKRIEEGCKVISIEKMNAWCLRHGIVPDYVICTDACGDITDSLSTISSGTTVILATQCGQQAVDSLKGKRVVIFSAATEHLDLCEMTQRHGYFPSTVLNAGGSVTLAGMSAAMALGMTELHVFGFDCHVTHGAYAQGVTGVGPTYHTEWIDIKDKDGKIEHSFLTTPPYLAFAQQFFKLCDTGKACGLLTKVRVYGDSIVAALSVEDIRGAV